MANDINIWLAHGHLADDAEVAKTAGGTDVAKFRIAVNSSSGNNEFVSYFSCELYGKLVNSVGKYLTKGKEVSLAGYPRQNRWKDGNGNNQSRVTFTVTELNFCGSKDTSKETVQKAEVDEETQKAQEIANKIGNKSSGDGIPF